MAPTRRNFLTIGGLAAASTVLSSCGPFPGTLLERGAGLVDLVDGSRLPPEFAASGTDTWRVLSRATFGPCADERARAAQLGVEAWIDEQLAPESIADARCDVRLMQLETLQLDRSALFDVPADAARGELQQAALLRAIHSRRQLYEVMVDFWSDHFSISTLKGTCAWLKTLDDREVIRPHALGRFADLLRASMRSPAMLTFLDNVDNRAGNPNENYARELLELHTLGVDAGYSQHDVAEVARCLTGWCVDSGLWLGTYRFRPGVHDDQPKQVLDIAIPAGGGEADGDMVCEAILRHPALSRFLARKLARRFVADEPPVCAGGTRSRGISREQRRDRAAAAHDPTFARASVGSAQAQAAARVCRRSAASATCAQRRPAADACRARSHGPAAVRVADAGRLSRPRRGLERQPAAALAVRAGAGRQFCRGPWSGYAVATGVV